jgi:chromosome segregation ATPase
LTSANQTLRVELQDISNRLSANLNETSTQNALHKQEVEHLHFINDDLRSHLSAVTSNATRLESTIERLQARIIQLESENKSHSMQYRVLQEQMHAAVTSVTEAKDNLVKNQGMREQA